MYATTKLRDLVNMNERFVNFGFKTGYDPAHFVADLTILLKILSSRELPLKTNTWWRLS